MSVKATAKTQIDCEGDLIEALESIYGKKISVVENGVEVKGYTSDVRPTIIVGIDGLIGTAGYYKNPANGKYELVYDSWDRARLKDLLPEKDKKGVVVKDRLAQSYSRIKVTKALKNLRGGRLTSETVDEDGNIKIKIKVSAY